MKSEIEAMITMKNEIESKCDKFETYNNYLLTEVEKRDIDYKNMVISYEEKISGLNK